MPPSEPGAAPAPILFASAVARLSAFIRQPRIPWVIRSRLEWARSAYFYYGNILLRSSRNENGNAKTITFHCGFHGRSGAVYAIANIAKLLSKHYHVEFVSHPSSNYNELLHRSVRIVSTPSLDSDLFICDNECEHDFYERVKAAGRPLLIICQGFRDSLHGLDPAFVGKSVSYADHVHLVSRIQQESFELADERCFVIPNLTYQVQKESTTNCVGTVGDLASPRKNADLSVRIALRSNADCIHLWSLGADRWKDPRVKVHSWESDKNKIYDSFDVLVFMSLEETFGMVIIEAMSAGVPCLLSKIPVFEQFSSCPGVELVDVDQVEEAIRVLNELLSEKAELKERMIAHWRHNYSAEAIESRWLEQLERIWASEGT
jgi:glycosyltransferase involved in cell wall biosynthesis